MGVVIEVVAGPDQGRVIRLRDGLLAKFGRTEWADFCFPADTEMAEFHFQLDCRSGCMVRALEGAELFINGAPATDQPLVDGDRVKAGQTEFAIKILGGAAMPGAVVEPVAVAEAPPQAPLDIPAIVAKLGLSGAAPALAASALTIDGLRDELASGGDYQQAAQLCAYSLDRRQAVAWGCHCVGLAFGETLEPAQRSALAAAAAWVKGPGQAGCRAAEQEASRCEYRGPGGLLAAATFWCGESLAPESSPEPVPPDETLPSRAIAGALMLAMTHPTPDVVPDRFAEFVAVADRIRSGGLKPEDAC